MKSGYRISDRELDEVVARRVLFIDVNSHNYTSIVFVELDSIC